MIIPERHWDSSLGWYSKKPGSSKDHSWQYCLWKSSGQSGASDCCCKKQPTQTFSSTVATGIRYQVGKCRRISLCWASPALDHRPSLSSYPKDSYLRRGNFLHRHRQSASTRCLCQTHEGAHYKLYYCSPFVNHSGCGFDSCLGRWWYCWAVTIMTSWLERASITKCRKLQLLALNNLSILKSYGQKVAFGWLFVTIARKIRSRRRKQWVYHHVNIVTCNQDFHVYLDGILAVKDSQIVYVGQEDPDFRASWADYRLIRPGSLPGLVNCHTHSAMTGLRGIRDDSNLHEWLNDYIWPAEAEFTPDMIGQVSQAGSDRNAPVGNNI